MELISWGAWKRRNPTLPHYIVWDGVKGWVREIVTTTLQHYGYKIYIQDYDYGLCEDIKPKHLAIKLIEEYQRVYGKEWWIGKELIYYHCRGSRNGFMDNLYVLARAKCIKQIDNEGNIVGRYRSVSDASKKRQA